MAKLWSFNGGLHLDEHKAISTQHPLKPTALPKILVYPLLLRPGIHAKALVHPGEHVLRGQLIADSDHFFATPVHAASSGVVTAIEERPVAHPSGLTGQCIVIETDGRDLPVQHPANPDFHLLDPDSVRAIIRQAGIVGLGGAAFPTAVKLVPRANKAIDILIINGAECEPYITCDESLMRSQPEHVITGAQVLMHALGIGRCIIAVEDTMPQAYSALQTALERIGDMRIELASVPTVYPTGGERQLIRVLTGKETPSGGIPADVGVVCQNAGTAAAVYQAVCMGQPLTERIITVTGPGITAPQNLSVRIGTPISDLVSQCGGYTPAAKRLVMGGPMMGFALSTDAIPVMKATNCILVTGPATVDNDQPVLPCIRCGECANACPAQLLPQQLYWYSRASNVERAQAYNLADCIECGCCNVVCPSHIPLVQYFRFAKGKLQQKALETVKTEQAKYRHEIRSQRKEKEDAEKAERARKKREMLEKMKTNTTEES